MGSFGGALNERVDKAMVTTRSMAERMSQEMNARWGNFFQCM
jgi:hypothetical protein